MVTATHGARTLFFHAEETAALSVSVQLVVPPNAPDGAYAPAVAWSDLAGNRATATFATVSKTNEAYTAAVEAHDLDGAKGKVGAAGAFKGTVSGLFERPGFLIVNFDKNYKTALSAVVPGLHHRETGLSLDAKL